MGFDPLGQKKKKQGSGEELAGVVCITNHRVDTARNMLGQMARMVTTRTRLAMPRLILLAEMVPVYMSLFSYYVEFRVLFLVINEMV
jgi:hypothetical protein